MLFNVRTITLVDINAARRMSKLQWTEMACCDRNIFLMFQVHNASKVDMFQYILGVKTAYYFKKVKKNIGVSAREFLTS